MRSRVFAPIVVVSAALLIGTACTYIPQSEFEEVRDSLDQDGDGASLGGQNRDCDDNNPDKTPGAEEVPYDGLDNDCGGDGDLVDIDGDGYPGITRDDYLAKFPDAEWPNDVADGPVDCIDDTVMHPDAAEIYPNNDNDVPYDGIDSDCAEDNDFDFDGDNYLPDTFVIQGSTFDTSDAFDAYVSEWGYDLGTPDFGDCNDFDEFVNPGSTVPDVPYDGEDQDCDGANDFDVDGDLFMPDEANNAGTYQNFIEQYHDNNPPWPEQWGDCLDEVDPAIVDPLDIGQPADPALIHPAATDFPYDGLDSDCDAGNDFDGDGDGYMPPQAELDPNINYDYYITAWGYTFPNQNPPNYLDCDDTDPLVHPEAQERIGDAIDQDCELGPDITQFGFDVFLWEGPRQPTMTATNTHFILVVTADYLEDFSGGGPPPTDIGVGIAFDKAQNLWKTDAIGVPVRWQGASNPQPLGGSVDAMGVGDDYWATTSYVNTTNNWNYAVARKVHWDGNTFVMQTLEYAGMPYNVVGTDIDVYVDPAAIDTPWIVSCSPNSVHVVKGTGTVPAPAAYTYNVAGLNSDLCFISQPPFNDELEITYCGSTGCNADKFQSLGPTLVGQSMAYAPSWYGVFGPAVYDTMDFHPGVDDSNTDGVDDYVHVGIDPAGGAWVHTQAGNQSVPILQTHTVYSVDAMMYGGQLYVAAVIDFAGNPEALLAYGNPLALTEVPYPFVDTARPNLIPEEAAIHVDDAGVGMAITAYDPSAIEQDAVGWVFLGW